MYKLRSRNSSIPATRLRSTLPQPCKTALNDRTIHLRTVGTDKQKSAWWKDAVIYQIYVPSFKDANGDGYGDLRGVFEKLEYLVDLGINIIWLSPIFESPMHDMGYDISDYYNINPLLGNMEDFNNLLEQAHKRGFKIILDIALNHTSSEHAWFQKSIAAHKGEYNKFKDFYIWGDPIVDEDGNKRPPSNWESVFEGCQWESVPETNKYYLHVFGTGQPDLNWDNPRVRKECWKVLRFWLDKGVDGFRLDAINCISKVHNHDVCAARPGRPTSSGWPDAPISTQGRFEQKANTMFANGPRVHEYLHEMYEEVFAHYDALSLGEMSCGIWPDLGLNYISKDRAKRQLDLILHFEHVELDCYDGDKWDLREFELPELKSAVREWQTRMHDADCWDTIWMENHDQPRGLSRFCRRAKAIRQHAAKLLSIWLFTLQGTVIMFQGQELGMTNPEKFSEEMIRDIETRIYWNATHAALSKGEGVHKLEMAKDVIVRKGRDASRIPIPWNHDPDTSGGFTDRDAKPWLTRHPDFHELSAESQCLDSSSVWTFYHNMIRLRRQHPALIYGACHLLDKAHPSIYAYTRTYGGEIYLVVLNFGDEAVDWEMPSPQGGGWSVVVSTSSRVQPDQEVMAKLQMGPFDGVVFRQRGG